jgi:hypothetical protein
VSCDLLANRALASQMHERWQGLAQIKEEVHRAAREGTVNSVGAEQSGKLCRLLGSELVQARGIHVRPWRMQLILHMVCCG